LLIALTFIALITFGIGSIQKKNKTVQDENKNREKFPKILLAVLNHHVFSPLE
jgi:hypothetical protein